ncbi:MAG: F0F1 ATP synthase subunit epsilon [Actinomycetota bacterium]
MPMQVAVVDPEKELWSGEADFVVARSADGEIGILPNHAPFLGVLNFARLKVQAGGDTIIFAVHGGFIEVKDNRVSVLARSAEVASDIDVARARDARTRAEEALREQADDHEALEALWRADARIMASEENGGM